MDFFEQQHKAKIASRLLVGLFLLALILLMLAVDLGVFGLWHFLESLMHYNRHSYGYTDISVLNPPTFSAYWTTWTCLIASLATFGLFAYGSFKRFRQLGRDNVALAMMLDATEVSHKTDNAAEKQFTNVAEEMAIAAGTSMPRLFVMQEEKAINAFVAGVTPNQLLVITQGALDELDRDELQGLIGHEFSHLLNGDTHLNMRMMVWLAGLTAVSQMGRSLMQGTSLHSRFYVGSRFAYYRQRETADVWGLGIILFVLGYAGLFSARLIKAAISRQREALADASARQFTRSESLASALVKIKNGSGSLLTHPFSEDINHMCFGDAVSMPMGRLLSIHPPIDERLMAIDPRWIAKARVRQKKKARQIKEKAERNQAGSGNGQAGNLAYAQQLLTRIPDNIRQRLRQPEGACLVIYALLAVENQQTSLQGMTQEEQLSFGFVTGQVKEIGASLRLPILDLALPALKQLDRRQIKNFLANVNYLIKSDGRVSLFEYLMQQLIRQRLATTQKVKSRYSKINQVAGAAQILLSAMVYKSGKTTEQQQKLFQQYAQMVLPQGRLLLPLRRCSLKRLVAALKELRQLSPLLKRPLLQSCADIVLADMQVETEELELLRLVCLLIDSPLPDRVVKAYQPD